MWGIQISRWILFFFPLWWKGNYSPLPQHLPQCFRDHSASFRDKHFTYNPSASFRDLVFVVLASATTVPLRFLSFFHFGLVGLHLLSFLAFFFCYVRLSWAWTLSGHRRGVRLFGHVVLPRCFREASARLPRNTESKPVSKPRQRRICMTWEQFMSKSNSNTGHGNWATSGYSNSFCICCISPTSPSATFREGHPSAKLPRPSAAWTLCAF